MRNVLLIIIIIMRLCILSSIVQLCCCVLLTATATPITLDCSTASSASPISLNASIASVVRFVNCTRSIEVNVPCGVSADQPMIVEVVGGVMLPVFTLVGCLSTDLDGVDRLSCHNVAFTFLDVMMTTMATSMLEGPLVSLPTGLWDVTNFAVSMSGVQLMWSLVAPAAAQPSSSGSVCFFLCITALSAASNVLVQIEHSTFSAWTNSSMAASSVAFISVTSLDSVGNVTFLTMNSTFVITQGTYNATSLSINNSPDSATQPLASVRMVELLASGTISHVFILCTAIIVKFGNSAGSDQLWYSASLLDIHRIQLGDEVLCSNISVNIVDTHVSAVVSVAFAILNITFVSSLKNISLAMLNFTIVVVINVTGTIVAVPSYDGNLIPTAVAISLSSTYADLVEIHVDRLAFDVTRDSFRLDQQSQFRESYVTVTGAGAGVVAMGFSQDSLNVRHVHIERSTLVVRDVGSNFVWLTQNVASLPLGSSIFSYSIFLSLSNELQSTELTVVSCTVAVVRSEAAAKLIVAPTLLQGIGVFITSVVSLGSKVDDVNVSIKNCYVLAQGGAVVYSDVTTVPVWYVTTLLLYAPTSALIAADLPLLAAVLTSSAFGSLNNSLIVIRNCSLTAPPTASLLSAATASTLDLQRVTSSVTCIASVYNSTIDIGSTSVTVSDISGRDMYLSRSAQALCIAVFSIAPSSQVNHVSINVWQYTTVNYGTLLCASGAVAITNSTITTKDVFISGPQQGGGGSQDSSPSSVESSATLLLWDAVRLAPCSSRFSDHSDRQHAFAEDRRQHDIHVPPHSVRQHHTPLIRNRQHNAARSYHQQYCIRQHTSDVLLNKLYVCDVGRTPNGVRRSALAD